MAGCALNPPPTTDDLRRDALPHTAIPAAWKAAGGAAAPVADRWLATFDDPALSALVAEALAYNADLRSGGGARRTGGGICRRGQRLALPTVGLAATQSGNSGGGGGLNAVFLNASLELDVWGRLRYGQAAAEAQSAAVTADYAYARQSLAAIVAKAWFVAIEAGLQRAIAQDVAALVGVAAAHRAGAAARRQRQRAGGGGSARQCRHLSRHFCGRSNWRASRRCARSSCSSAAIPRRRSPSRSNCRRCPRRSPSACRPQLLERRPDVIAAERRVAAAFNRIGEAKAALLPRISLTAGGSTISSDVFVLQDRANPAFSFGANLLAPIYQGGVLRAQVEIRTAEQKQAVAEYARTGQRAFAEVENALAAENTLRDREAILDATSATARARWNSRRSSIAWVRSTCARSSRTSSRCIRRGCRSCACRPSDARSASTCTSRWAAAPTCRPWNPWRRSSAMTQWR